MRVFWVAVIKKTAKTYREFCPKSEGLSKLFQFRIAVDELSRNSFILLDLLCTAAELFSVSGGDGGCDVIP